MTCGGEEKEAGLSRLETPPPSPQLMVGVFPSKDEIHHLAKLALEEMQREATTDPAAWIASYERIIMAYRRLALSKQQASDSEAWERANEAVKAANALQVEVDRLRDMVERAQSIISRSTYPNWHASAIAALSSATPEKQP